MTKREIVERVAKKVGLTKKAAAEAVGTILGSVRDALSKGDKVVLTGFGTFKVRSRAARKGRNPQTGASITIPGHKLPGFIAGKGLKKSVK